jgi:hypothetical protein
MRELVRGCLFIDHRDGRDSGVSVCLCALRVHGLLEGDTELLAYRLELLEILFVLALVLDLVFDAWGARLVSVHHDRGAGR